MRTIPICQINWNENADHLGCNHLFVTGFPNCRFRAEFLHGKVNCVFSAVAHKTVLILPVLGMWSLPGYPTTTNLVTPC